MRAHELRGQGLNTLTLVERPMSAPGPGQVLVRMRAVSLNYRDLLIATDTTGTFSPRRPLIPLSDGAGEVVETGAGVQGLARGDRVAGAFFQGWLDGPLESSKGAKALGGALDGTLTEYMVLDASGVVRYPASLSFEEAATLPCAAVTAWVGLVEIGKLSAADTVLTLGTGGVSIFAIQIAKAFGARVISTSSRTEKLHRLRELQADETIDSSATPDWAARALALTDGKGVDHCLDVGGAGSLGLSLRAVRAGGSLSLIGLLSGKPADMAQAAKNEHGVRVQTFFVGSVRHFEAMNDFITRVGLRPVIDRVFAFAQARDAYDHLARGAHLGKVVITL